MTTLELEMIALLRDMRDKHGVTAVKAEFEAEASRIHEVMRLKEIADNAELGLVLKIGGAEAITDMFEAQHIGTSVLIAPMIESAYALRKYLDAIEKYFPKDLIEKMEFGVNIETKLAFENFSEMLLEKKIKSLNYITVGRVDLSGSLGFPRNQINSNVIYVITEDIFAQAKKNGFKTAMGGGIGPEAAPFIKRLVKKDLLDRFETRKVVLTIPNGLTKLEEAIVKANRFELMWLENKRNYYSNIYTEDQDRIKMLKTRV